MFTSEYVVQVGATALIVAAYWGQTEATSMLLDRGANIEAKDNVCVHAISSLSLKAALFLFNVNDCFVVVSFKDGHTALIFAAFNGNTEVASILLDRGANIEAKDNVCVCV